jgi:hypothetical protein
LKCDIEGAKRELFSDCRAWIGRVRNISIEVHGDYTRQNLMQDLARNGANFVIATPDCGGNVLLLQRCE